MSIDPPSSPSIFVGEADEVSAIKALIQSLAIQPISTLTSGSTFGLSRLQSESTATRLRRDKSIRETSDRMRPLSRISLCHSAPPCAPSIFAIRFLPSILGPVRQWCRDRFTADRWLDENEREWCPWLLPIWVLLANAIK